MKHTINTKDGLHLFIEEIGSGFPLVFLHGNNLNSHYFTGQRSLSNTYRLVFIDSRGHGKSSKTVVPLTFSQLADDLEIALETLGISACLLVGHSDGANLALTYVQKYPKRVRGLLLNGGNFSFSALNVWVRMGVKIELFFLNYFKSIFPILKRPFAVAQLLKEDIVINHKQLNQFQGPVLVLMGEREMISLEHSRELANAFQQGQLVIVPKLGHNIANRQPNLFNHYIKDLVFTIQKEV